MQIFAIFHNYQVSLKFKLHNKAIYVHLILKWLNKSGARTAPQWNHLEKRFHFVKKHSVQELPRIKNFSIVIKFLGTYVIVMGVS